MSKQQYRRPIIIGLALGFILGIAFMWTASSLIQSTWKVSSSASLKAVGVEVYWDLNQTAPVTAVNWGILEPGNTKNVTIYVVNKGNVPISLSMTTGNWQPTNAPTYISLTWNHDGTLLSPSKAKSIVLSLDIAPTITGITTFSFDITITGSG